MSCKDTIIVQGAREHNLKNIHVEIPKNSLTVITGLSGSGKSSLAFDTLYAEGRRRYVESLSTYARQFLGRIEKPDVDTIIGLSPAISIEQKTASHNPRSTVGTITEIYDYLRLLYARIGKIHCHRCGQPISSLSVDQITDAVMALADGTKIIILSPLVSQQKGSFGHQLAKLRKDGFARARIDGEIYRLEDLPDIEKHKKHDIEILIDRLIIKETVLKRLSDSVETALSYSGGAVMIDNLSENSTHLFSESLSCTRCGISYPEFTPASFSFNSPQGACKVCDGMGALAQFDPHLIVPDEKLSLRQGAVLPWVNRDSVPFMEFLDALVSHFDEDIYKPFENLSRKFRQVLFYGSGTQKIAFYTERAGKKIVYSKPYEGIIPAFEKQLQETSSARQREEFQKYMRFNTCSACRGSRLNPASSAVKVHNKSIWEITDMPIEKSIRFFETLKLSKKDGQIASGILKELSDRLGFLSNVGLEYLSLNRSADTLSGGESQRIRLATQIGSKLSGVLYVLDEPSIGLHQKDNARLLSTLMNLKNLGNTVLVVEHDEETIRAADYLIDIGPGAGVNGGKIMFSGTPENIHAHEHSLTGQYLSGRKTIPTPQKRRNGNNRNLTVLGAAANNLKNLEVSFPLGCLTCVTGVSGSGKSTLVLETLYKALANRIYHTRKITGEFKTIKGISLVDKVIHIDQSPIGKTPRSNPATYTQLFNPVRELFAQTKEARAKGYKPGRFSFNVKGGRCEACGGDGIIKIEMHFMPDVYVLCDVCKGMRYNRETLEVGYKGRNIAQVLDMTVNQAVRFFETIPAIRSKLDILVEVGLGYIKLGQPGTTLSGGEAQRMKLARELSKKDTGNTVYILDEPTTGLHPEDINKLLYVLNRLVDANNTIIVIEHNLDVIKCADHIIDMGPEGGDKGGQIIAQGTPEAISQNNLSYTGYYLKQKLNQA